MSDLNESGVGHGSCLMFDHENCRGGKSLEKLKQRIRELNQSSMLYLQHPGWIEGGGIVLPGQQSYIYTFTPLALFGLYIYIYLQPVSYSMSLPRFYDDHSRSNSSEREIYICCQIYSSVEGLPYILKLLFIVFKLNRTHLDNIKKGDLVSKESKYHFEKIEK
jgi:hypothetical protein